MPVSLWHYPGIIEKAADDLLKPIQDYPNDFFERFFVPRLRAAKELLGAIHDERERRRNVLVVGDPGTGKTSFLRWFLHTYRKDRAFHYFIDLRRRSENGTKETFIHGIRLEFMRAGLEYVRKVHDDPCQDFPKKLVDEANTRWYYEVLCEKLCRREREDRGLFIFVDDIDYVDRDYFTELLLVIKPFLLSKNCCVVVAARNPAYNGIIADSDYFMFEKAPIVLTHLAFGELIRSRVELICSGGAKTVAEKHDECGTMLQRVGKAGHAIADLLSAKECPAGLLTINYPFTPRQEAFIQEISNGNIWWMLEMACQYLKYMARHSNDITDSPDGGYSVGRKATLDHFTSASVPPYIRIHDVHARKSFDIYSKQERKRMNVPAHLYGNSLYVLILESLLDYQSIDAARRKQLEDYGFPSSEVDDGIANLYNMEMIEEKRIVDRRPLGLDIPPARQELVLTPRGKYYVQYMINWDEYIALYGRSRHHEFAEGEWATSVIRHALLQFVVSIIIVRQENGLSDYDFRISKNAFLKAFNGFADELLVVLNKSNKPAPVTLTLDFLTQRLKDLRVIYTVNVEKKRTYLFYAQKIREACAVARVASRIVPPFFKTEVSRFVDEHVRSPEYEED